ncbi:MAG: RHS repeat-associated core domain-containing protein [Aridibacter sp.]
MPFGTALNAESTTSLSKRFTSYDRSDISGLDYAVNRTYNPGQGRFTQVDPIGMGASSLASPQTLNLYTYCGNDPINHTDPSGLFFGFLKKLFKWILVAVAVVVAVLTIIAAPATIVGILGAISAGANAASQVMTALGYKKIGVIFGIIAAATGFGSIIAAKIKGITFASEGIKGQINLLGGRYGAFGGVGAIANSLTRTERNQRRRFPCPPSVNRIHRQFARFLAKLLVNNSEHLTNSPLENGGWIYQRKNGDLFFLRAEKFGGAWRRGAGHIDTRTNPPNIRDARVVGRAHTHPYSPGVQKGINEGKYYGGPSNEDVELSIKDQIPELVAHQTGVSSITVEAASNVYSIPDKNCNRR